MNPAQEIVTIVDENNRVAGTATRKEMRARGLIHRATYILVFNSRGEIFVQKRTDSKDIYPGYYDVATGGVVLADESYEQSAARELAEELGILGTELSPLFDFYYESGNNKVWGRAFSCVYDGEVTLQEEEVASGDFYPIAEALAMSSRFPFTPDGLMVLRRYLDEQEGPGVYE